MESNAKKQQDDNNRNVTIDMLADAAQIIAKKKAADPIEQERQRLQQRQLSVSYGGIYGGIYG